jgi:hypothetical protein
MEEAVHRSVPLGRVEVRAGTRGVIVGHLFDFFEVVIGAVFSQKVAGPVPGGAAEPGGKFLRAADQPPAGIAFEEGFLDHILSFGGVAQDPIGDGVKPSAVKGYDVLESLRIAAKSASNGLSLRKKVCLVWSRIGFHEVSVFIIDE